jgi:F-type H+-transporting ATPase subunit b
MAGSDNIEQTFLGLGSEGWVYASVTVFIALVIWKKGHKVITGALDARIQKVKDQLAEATALRAEAEALKADAVKKKVEADQTALDIVANARLDAETLIKDAAVQAEAMVARRTKMAEDKIAAAERAATDDVRASAAALATAAARQILETKLDATGQNKLVDQAIGELDRRLH